MTEKILQLSSCIVKYYPIYETTKQRSYYTFETRNQKLPIFLMPHWMDSLVDDFMKRLFNGKFKYGLKASIFYPNNFYFPNPKKQLKGDIYLNQKVNKRNELITTLQCWSKGGKKCSMAIMLTREDFELLSPWLEMTIQEWQDFGGKIKTLHARMCWKNDKWKSL